MIPSLVWLVKGSSIAAAAGKVTAGAQIQSLVWDLPYATGVAPKRQKQKQQTLAKTLPSEMGDLSLM